ncbi:MAG: RecX family transcriptional regulator, partial [Usitatibacter sp.]
TKGVAEEIIDAAFKTAGSDGASNIEKIWSSRFDTPAVDDRERARHVRFLQGRGFSLDDTLRFLKRNPSR